MISPDGTTLAFNGDGGIYVVPMQGGNARLVAGNINDTFAGRPSWSPDGRRMAFLRHGCTHCESTLYVMDLPGGRETELGRVCSGTPIWTPDGKGLIAVEAARRDAGCEVRRLALIPSAGGPRVQLATEGDVAALTTDGRRLAYASGNVLKTVRLGADYRFAEAPVTVATEPHAIRTVYWTSDGGTLVYQMPDYTRAITAGKSRLLRLAVNLRISQILEDGSAVGVEARERTTLWRKDLRKADSAPVRVGQVPLTDSLVTISPDGQWQAFETSRNGPSQIWVSRRNGEDARVVVNAIPPFQRYGDNTGVTGLSWSPDGRQIAFTTDPGIGHGVTDARLFVVAAADGTPRKVADAAGDQWTADGKSISVVKYSDRYAESYFLADVETGRLRPARMTPESPSAGVPKNGRRAHLAEGGRALYFETSEGPRPRMVMLRGVLQ